MNDLALVSPLTALLIPVIVGLTQIVKPFVGGDSRYAPVISVVLGIIGAFLLPHETQTGMTILGGIVVALSSMGLYSGTQRINTTIKDSIN